MERKRVLQIAYKSLANGGIQSVIMGIVRNLSDEFEFDIIVFTNKARHYDNEFLKHGKKIHRVPISESNSRIINSLEKLYRWLKIFICCYAIIKREKYDVVHCHNEFEGGLCLLAARLAGVKIRISHAHNSRTSTTKITKRIYNGLLRHLVNMNSNVKIGCSRKANQFLFGKKEKLAKVINNSIDLMKFNLNNYRNVRKSNTGLNFIHIGRFSYQKNQLFLLEVFYYIQKKLKSSKLTLVGFGNDEQKIKNKIAELELGDSVRILPHDSNIPSLFAESDYMIFPSKFEGLGIVLLEAQAMGIKCFASDEIPPEANMGLCTFLSLEDSAEKWAEDIVVHISNQTEECRNIPLEVLKQYDIKEIAKKYSLIYNSKT